MNIEVLADSTSLAQRAASIIAEEAQGAIAARGRFVMGVSGGQTPWLMLRDLAAVGNSLAGGTYRAGRRTGSARGPPGRESHSPSREPA